MKIIRFVTILITLCAGLAQAQLTREQKISDFRFMASLYSKQYAPYEWKKELFGFDLLALRPWLDRVERTQNDLEFYDLCVEYVASLVDTHDAYVLPSNFVAQLGFTVDIYDGRVLIDSINRNALPMARFPFAIGDELISVDGRSVEQLLNEFAKYAIQGNTRATRRRAAARIVTRPQSRMPQAALLGASAELVIQRASGERETVTLPWLRSGLPLQVGPVPNPFTTSRAGEKVATGKDLLRQAAGDSEEAMPEYMRLWVETQHSASNEEHAELGNGARNPIYQLPANFQQRLGRAPADFFFSGTYMADGLRIGYIRIPSYGTLSNAVINQFAQEMLFFDANTDGLVVDEMRNPGGFLCFGEALVSLMTPYAFQATGYELRATWSRVLNFYNTAQAARAQGAPSWIVDLYESAYRDLLTAYRENRGRTGPISLCSWSLTVQPNVDQNGRTIAYTKPMIMLIDEFSTSTADSVPSMIQDARRGLLVGYRSNGAGGTNTTFAAGAYSEGSAGMTLGLMTKAAPVNVPGYPTTYYLENVGVHPDVELDYMTRDNLLQSGRPFVDAFTRVIVNHIRSSRP